MRIFLITFLILSLASCKSRKNAVSEENTNTVEETPVPSDSLFAQLKKTPCFGHCPVFTLTIYKSGFAVFNGQSNHELIGKHTGKFSTAQIDSIIDAAMVSKFYSLEDEYDQANVTDLPSTFITMNFNGKKTIKNRYGGPDDLRKLANLMSEMVDRVGWTKDSSADKY